MLMVALAALDPQESMFEPSAAQVRLELITHEPGQRGIALTEMREECVGVLFDHLVEQSLLGPVARVAPRRGRQVGAVPGEVGQRASAGLERADVMGAVAHRRFAVSLVSLLV